MRSYPIHSYIWCGTALRYLQDVAPDSYRAHGDGAVIANLKAFFRYLEEFELTVTLAGTGELDAILEELRGLDEDAVVPTEMVTRMKDELKLVRHTMFAEASGKIAFLVTEKRIEVNKLLNDVSKLLAPGVYTKLPEMARLDLAEGGRALAFELPTGAAFYVLRATEEVLRHFYRCVVRQNRVKPLLWFPMVDQMRKKKTRRPDDALLDVLDRIRVNFRNPTQHPDATYDIHEAQDLYLACLEAITRMVRSDLWCQ